MLDSFLATFKKTGLHQLRYLLKNKYQMELNFQRNWVKVFLRNPQPTLDYWNKHYNLSGIKKLCNIKEASHILGVGCSPSTVLRFLEGRRFAVDPLADEYKELCSFEGVDLRRGFGEYLPFENSFFDVVFCQNVLDHVSDPVKVISEVGRVLREKGFFVLVVEVFGEKSKRDSAHPHCFTVERVKELVSGFRVVFEKVVVWNPHSFYVEASDCVKTDLVLVCSGHEQ